MDRSSLLCVEKCAPKASVQDGTTFFFVIKLLKCQPEKMNDSIRSLSSKSAKNMVSDASVTDYILESGAKSPN